MRIRIADIPQEGREIAFDLSSQDLNSRVSRGGNKRVNNRGDGSSASMPTESQLAGDPFNGYLFTGTPHVHLKLEPEGSSVLVKGTATAAFKSACSRCAEDIERQLNTKLNLIVKPHTERSRESEDDELALAYYDGDELDCGGLVEEYLVLELPYTVLCSESCRGLCPKCGENLNFSSCGCSQEKVGDERFAVLKNLKLN